MPRRPWFLTGLFLTTLTTLAVEVLDTRLLSVMTWYHLSFFAVSTAMFGMSAGALRVYLGGERFEGERARDALAHYGAIYALSIPLAHLASLCVPIPQGFSLQMAAALGLLTVLVAIPFYFSGVVVALALTRIPGPIGLVYAVDLAGAALGGILLIGLFELGNAASAALYCGALAGLGALAFQVFDGTRGRAKRVATLGLALAMGGAGVWNATSWPPPASVWYSKGREFRYERVTYEGWSLLAQVLSFGINEDRKPFYWGAGKGAERHRVDWLQILLDGAAGTVMTRWDGTREGLAWVQHDVSALPYMLRRDGTAAVIGVGGGRDVLTALWGGHRVTGIEINSDLLELLEHRFRGFANLAGRDDVRLVHDEARSFLTRTDERYDVLQMSLIDTWAATGAGAFTLSENGLYTLEAWRVFLGTLRPGGVFSVSRWYDPERVSETSRLLALGTAALLETGVADPAAHVLLVSRGHVATLMLSNRPFDARDLSLVEQAVQRFGFTVLVGPGREPADPGLGAIVASRDRGQLARATAHPLFDYSVPTDARPFFFNLLKPARAFDIFGRLDLSRALTHEGGEETRGVVAGNLLATNTLLVLGAISLLLVLAVIVYPLARSGLPSMSGASFLLSVVYFAAIGLGFMLVQVPFMQRFSVYLGHPTYAVVVTLFSMILMTGLGSLLSDRLDVVRRPAWLVLVPLAIAVALFAETRVIQPLIEGTIERDLATRCTVVVVLVGSVSLLLGLAFPIGLRLVGRISQDATPWMWGVNGAAGVMGAVVAVAISMWAGIDGGLRVAVGLYGLLVLVAPLLHRAGRARQGRPLEPGAPGGHPFLDASGAGGYEDGTPAAAEGQGTPA